MKLLRFEDIIKLLIILSFITEIAVAGIPIKDKIPPKSQIDSITSKINKCSTDTCKFHILLNQFWKLRDDNSEFSEYYGRWAYQTIKNSNSLKDLSNGYDVKANLLIRENKLDSAFTFLNKALTLARNINYKFRIAWSYFGLGKIYDNWNKPGEAISHLIISRKLFFEIGQPLNHYIIRDANDLISKNYQKSGNYDSAIIYMEYNLAVERKYSDKKNEMYTLMQISDVYIKNNNIKKSTEILYEALKIAESLKDDNTLCSIYSQIGKYFYEYKRNNKTARDYYLKSLDISLRTNQKKMTASLYGQIARTYMDEGMTGLAMEYNRKSLKISEEINYRHALSDSYLQLGYSYEKTGNNKLALEYFKKCWQTQCDFCPPITFHEALIEIAGIYLKENNFSESLFWLDKSIKLADSSNSRKEIAISDFKLGDFYNKSHQLKDAEKYYYKALQTAREIKNIKLIKNIADTLSSFYTISNNYYEAFKYLKLARLMGDSLSIAEQQASMANLETNFEFERIKKDKETEAIKSGEQIKRQKIFIYFFIIISLLLTVLGIVIYVSYRRKKNDNILLLHQKQEIEEKNSEVQTKIVEITRQRDEIEKISQQLHEADQMKLRFFTNISHELRTPLTLIISPLLKLIKNSSDEDIKAIYSLMYRNTLKLQNFINSLLDISRIDKGDLKLNFKMNNLNKLVRIVSSMFQSISEEKNIDFNLVECDKDIIFSFDAERIDQVLNNLFSNAFKFTPKGGKITVQVSVCSQAKEKYSHEIEKFAEIKVWDNGIGIPKESLDKVFERFYQDDSTITRNFEGSGIGLALAKELVELHHGQLSVNSEPGSWTEFSVVLPMVINETENTADNYTRFYNTENLSDIEDYYEETLSKKTRDTILIIEDNTDLRFYLKECLSKDFNILLAENGRAGVENALKNIPDIIISDVMMPEMDGYQLTDELKGNINTSHIPIILLTAKASRDSKLEGLEKGADDYIIKPFDEEELILKVKNILVTRQRLQQKYSKQYTVNPSEIDVKSLDEIFLLNLTSSIEQELSNPELDIELLCKKTGFSRQQLYRKLKALTGLSINQFVRSIRLKRAAQLLKKKSATVSEIAYQTGFENLSYFTKKFKEEFGVLPSEYHT